MIQEIIVFILFASVLGFTFYKTFLQKKPKGKNGCGCDHC
ncbi:FeoB-associated Cys-rich membrane protein [Belliella baltica]